MMVFLKEFFEIVNFEKSQQTTKKNYPSCKESMDFSTTPIIQFETLYNIHPKLPYIRSRPEYTVKWNHTLLTPKWTTLFRMKYTISSLPFNCQKSVYYFQKIWLLTWLSPSYMGLDARKPVFGVFANNKGADRAVWSGPLLFSFWKVSYLNLLQAKFQFSN